MFHAAIGLVFVVLAAPPELDQVKRAADTLHQLRKPIHEWLARDIAEKTQAENRAYAARTRLAEVGIRQTAGQDAEATKLLTLVRDVVLDPPASDRGLAYYRLVSEYGAVCGRLAPAEARKRLEEIFTKLGKVPDTYTTATHYSRYHLLILEAAVLSLVEASDLRP